MSNGGEGGEGGGGRKLELREKVRVIGSKDVHMRRDYCLLAKTRQDAYRLLTELHAFPYITLR